MHYYHQGPILGVSFPVHRLFLIAQLAMCNDVTSSSAVHMSCILGNLIAFFFFGTPNHTFGTLNHTSVMNKKKQLW